LKLAKRANVPPYSGRFGVIFYSKVTDAKAYEITAESLKALFEQLAQPELVRRVYLVDDSRKDFQRALLQLFSSCVAKKCAHAEIVQIIDNENIYNAVNRGWGLVSEEYAISFHSDFRMIQTLPLQVVAKAFARSPKVYLIYLRARGLFGYNNAAKDALRRTYPWFQDYQDDVMETWYYRDERNRIFSIPCGLYIKQKIEVLPREQWGVQLVPRLIDANNTLWTPKLPSKLLPTFPIHESFAGGPVIFRTKIVQKYLPLPESYRSRPAAYCQEYYFWTTDVDFKSYTGYLNLQAFAIQFGDRKRLLWNYSREYWKHFRERNSRPVTVRESRGRLLELQLKGLRIVYTPILTRYRRIIADLVRRFMRKPFEDKVGIIRQLALSRIHTLFRLLPLCKRQGVKTKKTNNHE